MIRLFEIATFSLLAIVVHVILFAQPSEQDQGGSGAGGAAMISLEAAAATVAEMVETWERPPQIEVPEMDLNPPPAQAAMPIDLPRIELAEAPRAEMRMATLVPDPVPVTPTVDTEPAPPPPPSTAAVTTAMRPKQRPKPTQPPPDLAETARKAEQDSAGRAAQRASGTGGGSQTGQAAAANTASASKGEQAKAQAIWGAKIRGKIERAKRYPRGSNASGVVRLTITISRDGQLLNVSVLRSSGHPALDKAAVDAVRRVGRFPRAPRELTQAAYPIGLQIKLTKAGRS